MTNQNSKNESEKIFEKYLDSNGFQGRWTYEPAIEGKSKKLDYLFDWKENKCFFEVKELRRILSEPDTPSSIRDKINDVQRQFKEYKEYSCSLVVFNFSGSQAIFKPCFIFEAMLGNLGISAVFDTEKGKTVAGSERNVFHGGGKMIDYKGRRKQNTTISALIVLEEFLDNIEVEKAMKSEEKKHGKKFGGPKSIGVRMELQKNCHLRSEPGVIIIENPFARIQFPKDLFKGPFDERWIWDEKQNGKVERTFVGDKLKEIETLKESNSENQNAKRQRKNKKEV